MTWEQLLAYPPFQSSVVPFTASLLVAGLLVPLRLSGIGAASGWLAAVYVMGNFAFEPLTAMRKIVVLGGVAAIIGILADLAFRPTRATGLVLGAIFAAGSVWAFWTVLSQQPPMRALASAAGCVLLILWLTAATTSLQTDTVRVAATGLGLGIGVGVAAILGASALLGQYGLALGAACGGVVLLVMVLGKRASGGASLALPVAVTTGLLGSGSVLLAELHWGAVAALAALPIVVRLPLPDKASGWIQMVVASLYVLLAAAGACAIAYAATRMG